MLVSLSSFSLPDPFAADIRDRWGGLSVGVDMARTACTQRVHRTQIWTLRAGERPPTPRQALLLLLLLLLTPTTHQDLEDASRCVRTGRGVTGHLVSRVEGIGLFAE